MRIPFQKPLLASLLIGSKLFSTEDSTPPTPPAYNQVAGTKAGAETVLDDKKWFVEALGQYGYLQAPASPNPDKSLDTVAYGTKVNHEYPNTSGYTIGAQIGYFLHKNLAAFAGYNFRSFSWQTKSLVYAPLALPTSYYYGESEGTSRLSSHVLMIGIRPQLDFLAGKIYASLGFAAVLPYSISAEASSRFLSVGFSTASSSKGESESKYNLSPALSMEIGYQYPISSQMYLSFSIVGFLTSSTNNGKTSESKTTFPDGRTVSGTSRYSDSFSLADMDASFRNQEPLYRYQVIFPNDIGVRISCGYLFNI